MTRRRTRQQLSLAKQSTALALAAPQVVAHRMARMALAGPVLSERDQREFARMASEKSAAFLESWTAMWMECVKVGFSFAATGFAGGPRSAAGWTQKMTSAALSVAARGLAPVERRATANSSRLARTSLIR